MNKRIFSKLTGWILATLTMLSSFGVLALIHDRHSAATQRAAELQQMVRFIATRAEASITADAQGVIVAVGGELPVIGWTKQQLLGMKIHQLRPLAQRPYHVDKVFTRQHPSGDSQQLFVFRRGRGLRSDGSEVLLDGAVYWDRDTRRLYGFFALAADGDG